MKYVSILILALLIGGCSSVVRMQKVQTTLTYSDKLPVKVGLYIPPEISNYQADVPTSSSSCGAWHFPMPLGQGLNDAIRSGAETSVNEVTMFSSQPNFASTGSGACAFYLVPKLNNVNTDVSFTEAFFSNSIKANMQVSITINVIDNTGKTFYSFTSNGSGFENGSGSCGTGADLLSNCSRNTLQQIADNIAQTINSAAQIRDYVKSSPH